ncbi:MAG: PhzF family phenazine biosynthesis protein [Bacteroidota bacterium]
MGLLSEIECRGVIVSAKGDDIDIVSRCFYPRYGVNEDPVTGSAHTTIIPYWAKRLGQNNITAHQLSQRGGELQCTYLGDRVELGGNAVTFIIGEAYI